MPNEAARRHEKGVQAAVNGPSPNQEFQGARVSRRCPALCRGRPARDRAPAGAALCVLDDPAMAIRSGRQPVHDGRRGTLEVAPTEVFRSVAPTRRPNAELRTREHLTPGAVEALIEAANGNRYGHRDATMILIAFRHSGRLRSATCAGTRWTSVARCYTCDGSRTAPRAPIRSLATRCGHCVGYSAKVRRRPSSSSASAARRSRPRALPG